MVIQSNYRVLTCVFYSQTSGISSEYKSVPADFFAILSNKIYFLPNKDWQKLYRYFYNILNIIKINLEKLLSVNLFANFNLNLLRILYVDLHIFSADIFFEFIYCQKYY